MKKGIIAVVALGATAGTVIILKNKKGLCSKDIQQSLAKHLKESDIVTPRNVKQIAKKVDTLLAKASTHTDNAVVSEIIDKFSRLNTKQQKNLVKYVRKNFS